ncbi:MAG: O-succinylbenzoate synthase, partial [Actinomycetota bacterium]|nr:O-succinylbenzoate synthase [Actinomycetota bacterium]
MLTYSVPLRTRFRGLTFREGMVWRGAVGWGEFAPFADYTDPDAVPWLSAAVEAADVGWPESVRDRVSVNCTVPAVAPGRA